MARFQFFPGDRQTDKTDCLTPLRACARGVNMSNDEHNCEGVKECKS